MAYTDKETWKQIPLPKGSTRKNYAASSHGRLASFESNINDKLVLKTHDHEGYPVASIRVSDKTKALFPHQLIGALFLKKPSPKHKFVIHLDYDKKNNHISNLKWATPKELTEHSKKSPIVLKAIKHRIYSGNTAKKLDEKKVTQLKKELWNPKRKMTMKQLAAKYDIAEMNLYRIKVGEMWFHVHVEGEPIHDRYKTHLKNIEYHEKLNAKLQAEKDKKIAIRAAKTKVVAEKRKKLAAAKKVKAKQKKVTSRTSATIKKVAKTKKVVSRTSTTKAKTSKKRKKK